MPKKPGEHRGPAKTILLADDVALMRKMLRNILTHGGYNVVGEAENGQKAIDKYKELNPDLVILDITMPELDGITAVKRIKEINPEAVVIMCSAMGHQSSVMESINAGVHDFIVKPFRPERVLDAVEKALFK